MPVTIVYAQTESQTTTINSKDTTQSQTVSVDSKNDAKDSEKECKNDLICYLNNWGAVLAALIGFAGSFFGTSLITQKYRVRNLHLLPYVQWCVGAYGTIHEFKELYDYAKDPTKFQNPLLPNPLAYTTVYGNPVYVITHLWEMHREAEKGYKWIGQIEKENPCAHLAFDQLFDDVDKLWHYLENTYPPYLIGPQNNVDSFRKLLKSIPQPTRLAIRNDIIDTIHDKQFGLIVDKCKCDIEDDSISTVMEFLKNKIPKKSRFRIDI